MQMNLEAAARSCERVLIVDDNIDLAENIAEILEMSGYATEIAGSAEEALPRAMASEVTVVVTDYRLPGANGAELIRQVRRLGRQVRMIVMSAHTDAATVDDSSDAGALAFVAKPLDFLFLTHLLRASAQAA
jgi:two-component system CitB family response regulator